MNCLRCNTENDQSTKFCKNCGANLQPKPIVPQNTNSKLSDILLIIYIGIYLITTLMQFLLQELNPSYYRDTNRYLIGMIWIIQNLSFILVPLSIKNQLMKILGIIFSSLLILYWIYLNVKFMF